MTVREVVNGCHLTRVKLSPSISHVNGKHSLCFLVYAKPHKSRVSLHRSRLFVCANAHGDNRLLMSQTTSVTTRFVSLLGFIIFEGAIIPLPSSLFYPEHGASRAVYGEAVQRSKPGLGQ